MSLEQYEAAIKEKVHAVVAEVEAEAVKLEEEIKGVFSASDAKLQAAYTVLTAKFAKVATDLEVLSAEVKAKV